MILDGTKLVYVLGGVWRKEPHVSLPTFFFPRKKNCCNHFSNRTAVPTGFAHGFRTDGNFLAKNVHT